MPDRGDYWECDACGEHVDNHNDNHDCDGSPGDRCAALERRCEELEDRLRALDSQLAARIQGWKAAEE
jgi:hypothetical protein